MNFLLVKALIQESLETERNPLIQRYEDRFGFDDWTKRNLMLG